MRLSVKDRLSFEVLFPREGDITTQMMVRDIRGRISLTDAEKKRIGLKPANLPGMPPGRGSLQWNADKEKDLDPQFSGAELVFLKKQVEDLNTGKKITGDILDLCLKIRDAREKDEPKKGKKK